jgi:hypothetical protein
MDSKAARLFRKHALSLTSIASKLAPTEDVDAEVQASSEQPELAADQRGEVVVNERQDSVCHRL